EAGIRFPETGAATSFRQAYSARAGGIRPSALAACRLIEAVGQVAELGELEKWFRGAWTHASTRMPWSASLSPVTRTSPYGLAVPTTTRRRRISSRGSVTTRTLYVGRRSSTSGSSRRPD